MKKQVVVIGLGRFGSSVAQTLYQLGHDVLAIDISEKAVHGVLPKVTHAVMVDGTNEAALRDLGVSNFDVAVVGIGSDIQSSVMSTVLLKGLGLSYVIARAQNELHGSVLEKVGADKVVYPEKETGVRLAHSLANPSVMDYLEVTTNYGISKVAPPERFVGQTLAELDLGVKSRYGISVLAIKRGSNLIITPDRFERLQKGDILLVSARDENLEVFRS